MKLSFLALVTLVASVAATDNLRHASGLSAAALDAKKCKTLGLKTKAEVAATLGSFIDRIHELMDTVPKIAHTDDDCIMSLSMAYDTIDEAYTKYSSKFEQGYPGRCGQAIKEGLSAISARVGQWLKAKPQHKKNFRPIIEGALAGMWEQISLGSSCLQAGNLQADTCAKYPDIENCR